MKALVVTHGMGSAAGDRLLFGGCSAGARGASFTLDFVPAMLQSLGVPAGNVRLQVLCYCYTRKPLQWRTAAPCNRDPAVAPLAPFGEPRRSLGPFRPAAQPQLLPQRHKRAAEGGRRRSVLACAPRRCAAGAVGWIDQAYRTSESNKRIEWR